MSVPSRIVAQVGVLSAEGHQALADSRRHLLAQARSGDAVARPLGRDVAHRLLDLAAPCADSPALGIIHGRDGAGVECLDVTPPESLGERVPERRLIEQCVQAAVILGRPALARVLDDDDASVVVGQRQRGLVVAEHQKSRRVELHVLPAVLRIDAPRRLGQQAFQLLGLGTRRG